LLPRYPTKKRDPPLPPPYCESRGIFCGTNPVLRRAVGGAGRPGGTRAENLRFRPIGGEVDVIHSARVWQLRPLARCIARGHAATIMHAGFFGLRQPDLFLLINGHGGRAWRRKGFCAQRHGFRKAVVGVPSCSIPAERDPAKELGRLGELSVPDPSYLTLQRQGPIIPGKPGKEVAGGDEQEPVYVNIQFSVRYVAPRRQFLCLAGSLRPLGWSFNVASKHPAFWNPGHVWVTTVKPLTSYY
jgi:hypothetical protein